MSPKYGWFSHKSYDEFGYCIYLDSNNKEVMVVSVNDSNQVPPGKWDDMVCVGIVTKFIRSYWKNHSFEYFIDHKYDFGKDIFKIKSLIH